MEKASHNTFSYAQPLQWWLRPFAFVARCQDKTLAQQMDAGVRVFDLRLRQEKDGEWVIAHNAFIYVRGLDNIFSLLDYIQSRRHDFGNGVYVRVLHEVRNERQARYSSSIAFNSLCNDIYARYFFLRFFGGQRVMDWQRDYVFPQRNDLAYAELHASVRWPKWLHWWPWLYARLYNKCNERQYANKDMVTFTDFI